MHGEQIGDATSRRVSRDWSNLAARLDRLTNSQNPVARSLAEAMERVLGVEITAVPSTNGKMPGYFISPETSITLPRMGAGVANAVTLLSCLVEAKGKLFLIEEPENDLHPAALRETLRVIEELSADNQFVVSTHSHVVLRQLGSLDKAKVFHIQLQLDGRIPTSTVTEVPRTPEARREELAHLGYELSDLELYDGWLILEESSAERLIRQYLIPWFTPALAGRLRTVATAGVTGVEPAFEDFRRLFLYVHLESAYKGRAWVFVDGDANGKQVVQQLRKAYVNWPPDHFEHWTVDSFERLYPEPFASRYATMAGLSKDEKREAKRVLLDDLIAWVDANTEEAKREFAESAGEVVDALRRIEGRLITAR